MKQLLALLLCLAMILPMVPAVSARETGMAMEAREAVCLGDSGETVSETVAADPEGAKKAILAGLLKQRSEINIRSYGLSEEAFLALYWTLIDDSPELYYVDSYIRWYTSGSTITRILPTYNTKLISPAVQEAYEEKITSILSLTLGEGMTDLDKALALHDYLVLNCAYDWNVGNDMGEGGENVYSAYGALMEGNAVCEGYAKAYLTLLKRAGIDCGLIRSDAINHAWNWVELDGQRYHVDVTWDDSLWTGSTGTAADSPGACSHEYFLLDGATITERGHFGYDPAFEFTDATYVSGWVFNSFNPFFWHEGCFYTVTYDQRTYQYQVQPVKNLAGDKAYSSCKSVYTGSALYYMDWSDLYCYSFETGATKRLGSLDGGEALRYENGAIAILRVDGQKTPTVVKTYACGEDFQAGGQFAYDENNILLAPTAAAPGFLTLRNYGTREKTIQVAAAAYDDNHRFRQLTIRTITVPAMTTVQADMDVPAGSYAKCFVLGQDGTPLKAAVTLR